LGRWPLMVAVVLGPAAVAVNIGALQRCRPIGRPRRIGLLLPVLAWWLAAGLALLSEGALWPAALSVGLLYGFATIGLWHQERHDPSFDKVEYWPLIGHGLLLALAAWPAAWPAPNPRQTPLVSGGLRVAVIDAGGDLPTVARRAALVADEEPGLVLLYGLRRGRGLQFEDGAWWLARRLGLTLRQTDRGDLAILAAVPPAEANAPRRRLLEGLWPLGDSGLGVALVDAAKGPPELATKAVADLAGVPRRLIAGPPAAPPPPGYADPQPPDDRDIAFWLGPGCEVVSQEHPAPGVFSALLTIEP